MKSTRPGLEAIFQVSALWAAKRLRNRRRNSGSNDAEFYAEFFTDEDEDVFGWDPRTRHRTETVRTALESRLSTDSKILDVGCGLGEVLAGLPDTYTRFGVDFAESNVTRASRRLGTRAVIQQGSAYALPFEDASMDGIICLEVLEHLADDRAAVTELLRVLRPNGIMVLAVPYTYYWPSYLELMGHYRHYTKTSFTLLLNSVGLIVDDYLPNSTSWHQQFTRGFIGIKALYLLASQLRLYRGSLRDFAILPGRTVLIKQLERYLQAKWNSEQNAEYGELETSTFVVARRKVER